MTHQHLTDEQLIGLYAGAVPDAATNDLDDCDVCRARQASIDALLHEVSSTANAEADAAFPPERLARQHARILQRLIPHRQLARVLAFPNAPRTYTPPKPMRRWVAGAAAAGLVVGMVAGHLAHQLPGLQTPSTEPVVTSAPLHASTAVTSDDDFLLEIEQALSAGPAGLWQLERMTPGAWEQR
jgi:anti-sigma factor RsiW